MDRHHIIRISAIIVVCASLALAFTSSQGDSLIVDEVPHIGAGFSYVTQLDYHLNPEHPPLIKDLAGLALLTLDIDHSAFKLPTWTTDVNGQWNFGRAVIFNSGANPDTVKMVARLPMLGIFLLGCWLIWKWARERYGDTAALIALTLFAFSPTVLAHARLVTTDLGASVGVLAATYCFVKFLRTPTRWTFVLSAMSLGLALLTKFNTVLLIPFFIVIAIIYSSHNAFRTIGRTLLVCTTAFLFVVWPVYIVHTWNYPLDRQIADTQHITAGYPDSILKTTTLWFVDKPILRSAGHWLLGLTMATERAQGGNTIYWMGQVVQNGGSLYFPIVYLLKEPLAWWFLVVIALCTLSFHRQKNWFAAHLEECAWLIWVVLYLAISMKSTLNIGIRHLLPIYPFIILLVAWRVSRIHLRWVSILVGILMSWYVFESVHIWPSYLSYFNQLAGGSSGGYQYVTDSNLDWGQDLKRLGQWVEKNNIKTISLDYFGWADPAYYLKNQSTHATAKFWKDANDFIVHNSSDGWLAISGTYLQNAIYKNDGYRWLLDYQPVAVIGNSIFVWHITK